MQDVNRKHGDILSEAPKLGHAVTSSTPPPPSRIPGPPIDLDIDSDENVNAKFVLSGTQRGYILTGEGRGSDYNDDILAKRDKLPDRVQHLIDDIAALHDSPFLSDDSWESGRIDRKQTTYRYAQLHRQFDSDDPDDDFVKSLDDDEGGPDYYESPFESVTELWGELIDIDQRSQQVRDGVFLAGGTSFPAETQFGYEMGSMLQMLRPDQEEEVPGMDLIWGFLLAFIGKGKSDMDQERDILDRLVEELNARHESRQAEADRMADPAEIRDYVDYDDETKEAVETMGLTPHPILLREIEYHQPNLDEQKLLFKSAKRVLSDFIDVVPLREIDELESKLTADLSTIRKKSVPGAESVHQILAPFYHRGRGKDTESDDSNTTDESPNESEPLSTSLKDSYLNDAVDLKKSVKTRILHRITEDHDSVVWTTEPIIHKTETSGDSVRWDLTSYGALLLYTSFERGDDISLLYWYALGPEEISLYERKLIIDSLDELDLMR